MTASLLGTERRGARSRLHVRSLDRTLWETGSSRTRRSDQTVPPRNPSVSDPASASRLGVGAGHRDYGPGTIDRFRDAEASDGSTEWNPSGGAILLSSAP